MHRLLTKVAIAFLRYLAGRLPCSDAHPTAIRSLLLVELSRLGDVVSTLQAIHSLSAYFSQAHITLCVQQRYAGLVRALLPKVEVMGIDDSDSLAGLFSGVKRIRAIAPDLAVSLSPSKRNATFVLLSNSPRRYGYLVYTDLVAPFLGYFSIEAFGLKLKERMSYHMQNIEMRSRLLCLALGVPVIEDRDVAMLPDSQAPTSLVRLDLFQRKPYVLIHPFSGWKYRNWPSANFISIAQYIRERYRTNILFLCERNEQTQLNEIRRGLLGIDGIGYYESDSVLHSAAFIQNASLVIGNDSGPLHLAGAMGVPIVGLFGPAPPDLTAPYTVRERLLYVKTECSPCEQRRCVRPENPCMNLIRIEDVQAAVDGAFLRLSALASASHA